MRAPLWQPAEALSSIERTAMRRIRRAKLFVFLRLHRHTLREDMYNLMGHALRKAVGMVVRQREWELAEEAAVAGAPLLGAASPTAALDCDWDAPVARAAAQETVAMAQQVVQQLELSIFCKAWPLQQRAHCAKTAFALDWWRGIPRCPYQVEMSFLPGATVHWSMYPNRPRFGGQY